MAVLLEANKIGNFGSRSTLRSRSGVLEIPQQWAEECAGQPRRIVLCGSEDKVCAPNQRLSLLVLKFYLELWFTHFLIVLLPHTRTSNWVWHYIPGLEVDLGTDSVNSLTRKTYYKFQVTSTQGPVGATPPPPRFLRLRNTHQFPQRDPMWEEANILFAGILKVNI